MTRESLRAHISAALQSAGQRPLSEGVPRIPPAPGEWEDASHARNVGVESDGRTVWVNSADGSCVGRFSRFGIDIHRTVSDQIRGQNQCLDCTHQKPTLTEWRRFQAGMLSHYGVDVGDDRMPAFI